MQFILRKTPQFHLISWCGNFVVRHSYRIVSGELCGNCAFSQNSHTRKLGEYTVFYAVLQLLNVSLESELEKKVELTSNTQLRRKWFCWNYRLHERFGTNVPCGFWNYLHRSLNKLLLAVSVFINDFLAWASHTQFSPIFFL